jgi:toxin ParE1/3/4
MPLASVSERAQDDIARTFARIAPHNLQAALRVNHAIESAVEYLSENPGGGAMCELDDPRTADYRFWPLKKYRKYLVIYRPTADGIEVLRVLHGAQDMRRVLP